MRDSSEVLVTGVGGDVGQAVVKALRLSGRPVTCHGCDMDDMSVGAAFTDSFHAVPRADDPAYIESIDRLCSALGVDAVIPVSEPEIYLLSRLGSPPRLPSGIPVVCQNSDWIDTYGDKLACMRALSGIVDLAPFADGSEERDVEDIVELTGFPVVVKSRRSSGSRTLRVVNDPRSLRETLAETEDPIVQAYIDNSGGEFSVGIFSSPDVTLALAFRRELGPGGCSWHAETAEDDTVLSYALTIARETRSRGSINIQIRKSSQGPRLLEINPRFSSLAAARAAAGFRDVEWSLELALGSLSINEPQPFHHIRFHRFFGEVVDFGDGYVRIPSWDPRHKGDNLR